MNQSEENELNNFLGKLEHLNVPSNRSKEEVRRSLSDKLNEPKTQPKTITLWRNIGIAASVSLVVLATIFYTTRPTYSELSSLSGQTLRHTLPDSSTVTLNASSTLTYDEKNHRTVKLEGEAFFEVTKGQKFEIETRLGVITVLGTSFNVFVRDKKLSVACKTGKVKVSIPNKTESIITPGKQITLENDSISLVKVPAQKIGIWTDGELYFDNETLGQICKELSLQFKISIKLDDSLQSKSFTGYVSALDIETALDMICLPMGLQYLNINPNQYTIHRTSE